MILDDEAQERLERPCAFILSQRYSVGQDGLLLFSPLCAVHIFTWTEVAKTEVAKKVQYILLCTPRIVGL